MEPKIVVSDTPDDPASINMREQELVRKRISHVLIEPRRNRYFEALVVCPKTLVQGVSAPPAGKGYQGDTSRHPKRLVNKISPT
jgi:hypothetical protein